MDSERGLRRARMTKARQSGSYRRTFMTSEAAGRTIARSSRDASPGRLRTSGDGCDGFSVSAYGARVRRHTHQWKTHHNPSPTTWDNRAAERPDF